jgi:hypothetical protein
MLYVFSVCMHICYVHIHTCKQTYIHTSYTHAYKRLNVYMDIHSHNRARKRRYIQFVLDRVKMLLHYKITPIMVFDGANLPSKSGTITPRLSSAAHLYFQCECVWSLSLSLSLLSLTHARTHTCGKQCCTILYAAQGMFIGGVAYDNIFTPSVLAKEISIICL